MGAAHTRLDRVPEGREGSDSVDIYLFVYLSICVSTPAPVSEQAGVAERRHV